MGIQIVTADERLSQAAQKTSLMIVGPNGVGKTSLLRSIPEGETLCIDLEAGLKAVQDWRGISLPIRTYPDFRDLACLIGGADPAVDAASPYSAAHYAYGRHRAPTAALVATAGAPTPASPTASRLS